MVESFNIPSVPEVRELLSGLGHAQMQELARVSGVPFTTLWAVKTGKTDDPRIQTVRKFLPHVDAVKAAA